MFVRRIEPKLGRFESIAQSFFRAFSVRDATIERGSTGHETLVFFRPSHDDLIVTRAWLFRSRFGQAFPGISWHRDRSFPNDVVYDMIGRDRETHTMSKSPTTTRRRNASAELLKNPHPGEILMLEFIKPMGLSQSALARAIRVPPRRINEIVLGKRAITADTDLRLARYFRMSEGFFLGLQTDYDLMQQRRALGSALDAIEPHAA